MNTKKIIAIISAVCLACVMTACNKNNDSSDSSSDGSVTQTPESSMTSESDDLKLAADVIMRIGGHDVSVDEYKYYFSYAKFSIDGGDVTYWNDDEDGSKLSNLKQQTFDYLFSSYTVYSLADKNNVSLDDDDNKKIDAEILSTKNYYNAANSHLDITFDDYLKNTCCTEEVYRRTLERKELEYKIIAALYDKDYREKYFTDYIRVKYINVIPQVQFETDDSGSKTDKTTDFYTINPLLDYTDEEKAEIAKLNELSRANNADGIKAEIPVLMDIIAARLSAGESIDQLMEKYNMDKNVPLNYDGTIQGYYIDKTFMKNNFNDIAFALEENEISGILSGDDSQYFIIQRFAYDEAYLQDYLVELYMSDSDYTYADDYTREFTKVQNNMDVVYSDTYEDITIDYASINYDTPPV